jgi:hypothetical protein
MKGTSYTVINDGKSDEKYDENYLTFLFWLGFQILVKTLKSICQAPVRLIGKRGLICDHRNFV